MTWTEIEERGGSEAWEGKGHWCGGGQSGTVQVQPPGAEAACVLGRLAGAGKVRVRACVCVPPPFGFSLSDCQFEEIKKTLLRSLICAAEASRPELVFFLLFNDCRHVRYDEETHHEDLDEGDHDHEEHDGYCSASGTICSSSRCSSVFTVSLCLLHDRLVRPCVGLC